jgi:threonine dehydrogenase-like Zn-dependent dehydrogenase
VRDRRVLVTGAGVVGLLTALFAVEAGAAEVAPALVAAVARRERSALGVVFTFDEHHIA